MADVDGVSAATEAQAADVVPTILRHGSATDSGPRARNEDAFIVVPEVSTPGVDDAGPSTPSAYYGVFDGHCGICAATFVRNRLLDNVIAHEAYPESPAEALRDACLTTDAQFEEACSSLPEEASGTTTIVALVQGGRITVANVGDSRCVLSRRGQALALSEDQKPTRPPEDARIRAAGGYIDGEGFLNGQLAVSRAIGDWHLESLKRNADGSPGPLIADPEVTSHALGSEDEFMVMASDGLWDVFSSQGAVSFARERLAAHNDPSKCSEELIAEAMNRHTSDNVTVVVVCFHADAPLPLRTPGGGRKTEDRDKDRDVGMSRTLSTAAMSDLQKALNAATTIDAENEPGQQETAAQK